MGKKYYRYFIKEVGEKVIAIVAAYVAGKIVEKAQKSFSKEERQKALERLHSFFES